MSRGKKLLEMVLQLNKTKNDDTQCNTASIVEECIVTENGLLQKIDQYYDTPEISMQVLSDIAVMDLETIIDETNQDGKDKNDRYDTGGQMEAENAAREIIAEEDMEERQIIIPQAENFQLRSETTAISSQVSCVFDIMDLETCEMDLVGGDRNDSHITGDYELESDSNRSEYLPEAHSSSNNKDSSDSENDINEQPENDSENVEEAEEEHNNGGPPRKKKRRVYLKQDSSYLQNKKNRELGKAYQSKRKENNKWDYKVERPAKKIKDRCSCKLGKANSVLKCSEVTEEFRQEIFDKFWKLSWPEKKQYTIGLISLEKIKRRRGTTARRNHSLKYYLKCSNFKTYRVCKKMFSRTLGISENVMLLWLNKENSMTDNDTERVERPRRENEKTKSINQLKIFFNCLAKMESHYCRASTSKLYLEPLWQSKRELFRFYKSTWCVEQNAQAVSITSFSSVFNEMNLSLYRPKKDECDVCMGYKTKNISDEIYQEHLVLKEEARNEKSKDKLSETDVVLTMDLQSVLLAPKSKVSLMYYKTKLAVHNFTLYDIKSNDGYCFLWSEIEGSVGSNEFSSILTYFIENIVLIKIDKSVSKIILWSDGCTAQNRNNVLSNALLNIAIRYNVEIIQKYLHKGHTQMEADSMHSVIERRLRNRDINLPADYVQYCKTARLNPRPYFVKYCPYSFFKNFDGIKFYNSIRPGRKTGESLVTDLKQLRYNHSGNIDFKLRHTGEWQPLNSRRNARQDVFNSEELPQLYTSRRKIKKEKFNHLQQLKMGLAEDYHSFYDNIPYE